MGRQPRHGRSGKDWTEASNSSYRVAQSSHCLFDLVGWGDGKGWMFVIEMVNKKTTYRDWKLINGGNISIRGTAPGSITLCRTSRCHNCCTWPDFREYGHGVGVEKKGERSQLGSDHWVWWSSRLENVFQMCRKVSKFLLNVLFLIEASTLLIPAPAKVLDKSKHF